MAVMLNMIPAELKPMPTASSNNKKSGNHGDKSKIGFAKKLDLETDKNGLDGDSKIKSDDNAQLMAAMAGIIPPAILNLVPATQVTADSKGGSGSAQNQLVAGPNPLQTPLTGVAPNATQSQLTEVAPNAIQPQLTGIAPNATQPQLTGIAPNATQPQLTGIAPNATQSQLIGVAPNATQSQLTGVAPNAIQSQLTGVAPNALQSQLTGVTQNVSQLQLATVAPNASQLQLAVVTPKVADTTQVVVPGTSQNQLVSMGPGGTISKTGLNDMDALQSPLTGMTVKKGTVNPQVDSKQLGTFTALNTPNQVQLQMQNQSILGQAQVTEIAGKNTDMLSTNPVLSKTVISSSLLGSLNNTGKNNGKQVDGTKAATIPVNVGENSLGMMDAFQVKPILSSQEAVTIIDTVSSANKEKQAAILPKTPVADADVFANLLSQQGMKIENQTVTDVKSVPSQPVADPYHIASQIIDQAHLVAGAKNTEMIIQLKPEHLGELTFKVSVEGGVVSASFHSNNPEVRSIIESSLYQLKQEMFNQGLKVDNVGVYAGLGQFFSNGQQSRSNQQPVVKHQNKKTEEDFREALDATDSVGKVLNTTEVDYRA